MRHLPLKLTTTFICACTASLLLSSCAAPQKEFVPPVFPAEPEQPRYIYERSLISSGDVEVLTSAERFKQFATGESKRLHGLAKPYDISVHRGRVYVSDTVQRAIIMFDIPGSKFKTFGKSGAGILSKPIGVDVSDTGEVFVIDTTAKRVVVYDPDGKYLRTFGGKSLFERPTGIAVSNGRVYISDTGRVTSQGQQGHKIQVFDAKSGEHLSSIGKRGINDGEFNFPLMIDIDKNGDLYVIDSANFRVQRFDSEGKYLSSFGKVGAQFGNFSRPKGIAVDHEGKIYVVDTAFANFQIFNNEGQLLMFIGSRSSRNQPATFALPAGIDVDEDGRIYVVDQAFGKVEVFRPYELKESEGYAAVKKQEK